MWGQGANAAGCFRFCSSPKILDKKSMVADIIVSEIKRAGIGFFGMDSTDRTEGCF